MTTIYWAIVSSLDSNGRLANLTQALSTMEAYSVDVSARTATELSGTIYWTNLYTGAYLISVSDAADGLKVIFRGLVHADDQAGFADFAALLDQGIEAKVDTVDGIVDGILEDTGTTIPASIAAIATWVAANISASVTAGNITDIRGNDWSIAITDLTLDDNKQQFVIKRNASYEDVDSILFIDSDTGLLYVNGVAATAGDASIIYAGTTLTVTVKASVTAQLPAGTWVYGIQSVTAADVVAESYGGTFTITADNIKATA